MTVTPASPESFNIRRFLERRVKFLLIALPLCCLVLLLPLNTWLFELLRHFRIWCAVLGGILTVSALLLRLWRWVLPGLLTALWQGAPLVTWSAGRPEAAPAARAATLTVVTCNLYYKAENPDAMVASLLEADPDLILFQEFTPHWQHHFKTALWDKYPHRIEDPLEGPFGICLASRLPLEQAAILPDSTGLPVAAAVVTLGGRRIAVLGVHPMPPMRPSGHAMWQEAFTDWPGRLRALHAEHAVLAGDLNSTPFSLTFQQLCRDAGLRDSSQGFGLQNTWFALTPPFGLPLDHILTSPKLTVLSHMTGPDAGSDHRWVRAKLAVP